MIPPLPPVAKGMVFVFSIFMTLALLALIGFITVEFVADIAGHPLFVVKPDPTAEEAVPTEQELERATKGSLGLITPGHHTQMRGPEVMVIYTVDEPQTVLPDLRINSIQHPWEMQYGDTTWLARLWLPAGSHHLEAGEAEADFFVVAPGSAQFSPDLWQWSRPHRETNEVDRCARCHEMSDESPAFSLPGRDVAIGAWKGKASCFACHDEDEYAVAHRSVVPLTIDRNLRCVRCHTIH